MSGKDPQFARSDGGRDNKTTQKCAREEATGASDEDQAIFAEHSFWYQQKIGLRPRQNQRCPTDWVCPRPQGTGNGDAEVTRDRFCLRPQTGQTSTGNESLTGGRHAYRPTQLSN
ncbi:unnamed protein product [Protopolystoma xenopodis]|uniref:Uncharacterized protein n=1 Tax=Protopolystoma xenopodis TaxID=117903 RepID=A0A448WTG0_9PLAT|nr:unnamed protein product [Protopolystoma xenopodis]